MGNETSRKMIIDSVRFGQIEIDRELLFEFVAPIIGYDKHRLFALIDNDPSSPFKWIQSVKDEELAFPITLCSYFDIEYNFKIQDEEAKLIELENAEDLMAINIVSIPQECPQNATVNLLAPIVINTKTNKAMQVILKNTNYKVKHPLF